MPSQEQKRSEFALQKIVNIQVNNEMANFIVGTPNMIQSNGLGQMMAFIKSKGDEAKYTFVFDTISEWLHRRYPEILNEPQGFFRSISQLDQNIYLQAQEEAMLMLQWLKRYARSFQQ